MVRKLKLVLWLCALGCRDGPPSVVAFQKSLLIPADVGGTLTVGTADDSQLAGASITIPPGAFSIDTAVTIASSPLDVARTGAFAAGPTVVFGPSGTVLRVPATVTLPLALPAGDSPSQVFVEEIDALGNHELFQAGGLALDASAGVVGVQVLTLATYGAVVGTICASAQDCATVPNQLCVGEVCSGELSADVALGCGVDGNCLAGESCDAGLCSGGFDGGGGPMACVLTTDCPQSPVAETCVEGFCEAN